MMKFSLAIQEQCEKFLIEHKFVKNIFEMVRTDMQGRY